MGPERPENSHVSRLALEVPAKKSVIIVKIQAFVVSEQRSQIGVLKIEALEKCFLSDCRCDSASSARLGWKRACPVSFKMTI